TLETVQRAQKVPRLASPASANLEVLAVDLPVRVDRGRPDVGVVSRNHVTSAITNQIQPFPDPPGRPGGLDDDVEPFAVGARVYLVAAPAGRSRLEVVDL